MTRAHITYLLAAGVVAFPPHPLDDSRIEAFELASQETTGLTGPPNVAAWGTLNKGVNDSDTEHRKKALAAAGSVGPEKQAVELVARGLKDKDLLVRQTAAATLGEMKSPDAIPYLKEALDDSPEVMIHVGMVNYIDYSKDSIPWDNYLNPFQRPDETI